jgi:hypothetical protein
MSKCIKLVDNVYLVDTEEDMRKACNDCQNFDYSDIEFDAFVTVEVKQYPAIIVTQKGHNDHSIKVQPLPIAPSIVGIIAERMHQLSKGFTPQHDSKYFHKAGHEHMLVTGAKCYIEHDGSLWPWDYESFKKETERQDLVKGAAMIAAMIDVIDLNDTEHV